MVVRLRMVAEMMVIVSVRIIVVIVPVYRPCRPVISIHIVVLIRVKIRSRLVVSIYDNSISCARGNG